MRQWEITLEFEPKIKPFKSEWYWSIRLPRTFDGGPRDIAFGRAESLSSALDDIDTAIDVDLNDDYA